MDVNTLMEGNLAICILTVFTHSDLIIPKAYAGKIIAYVHKDLYAELFIIVYLTFFQKLKCLAIEDRINKLR